MDRQKFSHYLVGRKLGQGGMGELYLAEDTLLGRPVALKFLASQQVDEEGRRRLVEEARAAAAIDHPYVCKVYEAGEAEGAAFIAMEYVDGESLAARLNCGALSAPEACRLTVEIAEALAKAHECGIVHRDLKPSNVMLTTDNHVKVVDFGLAKRLPRQPGESLGGALTQTGVVMGTPGYMSPEQLCGKPLDARSDIFSLGVVFYLMLTGRHPFPYNSPMEIASGILKDNPAPVSQAVLQPIISRMLAKDPAARYASVRELVAELRSPSGRTSVFGERQPFAASIAVLPMVNRSRNEEDEYFSDGITEEIIIRLSKIGGLRVISPRTTLRFKNSDKTLAEIGEELGVEAVLEGSVGRTGQRIRVRAGLTEVATLSQIWGESYDRDASHVLAIEAEVADEIARALKLRFPSLEHRPASGSAPVVNVEAYNLYLKGCHAATRLTPAGFQQAWRDFQKALEVDPTHAQTYAALAITYARAANYGYLSPRDAFSRARAAGRKALEFDAGLAEAHTAMGLVAMYFEWDWPAAEQAFVRALQLNPNFADAHMFYSVCLQVVLNRPQEALREAKRAVELDPLSSLAGSNLALILAFQGRNEEALEQITETLTVNPDYLPGKAILAMVYWYLGRYDEGNRILEQYSWTRAHLAWGYAMAGRQDEARAILQELSAVPHPATFDLGFLCLLLEDLGGALEWLEKAWSERDNKLYGLRAALERNERLRQYLDEPRMKTFLARIAPRADSSNVDLIVTAPSSAREV